MNKIHRQLLDDFNQAFNNHDVDHMMSLMTGDCVFENTFPAPDGTRFSGAEAVREYWNSFFAASPNARIEIEDVFGAGDRLCQRWIYRWGGDQAGHVRGVDVFHIRRDRISHKLSCKG
jgi:ketosteroid isomerase-like protein